MSRIFILELWREHNLHNGYRRPRMRAPLHRKEGSLETHDKKDDTLGEEVSALGQRAKGAAKDMVGDLIDDEQMEAEGESENAAGRARQATNNVMDETDGVKGRTSDRAGM